MDNAGKHVHCEKQRAISLEDTGLRTRAWAFFLPDRAGAITERTHWDDVLLYQNIVNGLRAYRRDVADRLDGIGIDTWGADGQLLSADGDALGRVYCYRDHRLDTMVEEVWAPP